MELLTFIREIPSVGVPLVIATSLTQIVKYTYGFVLAQKLLAKGNEKPEEIVFFGFRWIRKHAAGNSKILKKDTKNKDDKDK